MQTFETFRDVIDLWPRRSSLARDIEMATPAVGYWWRNNVIPPVHYDKVIEAAKRRGFYGVTYPVLAALARGERSAP